MEPIVYGSKPTQVQCCWPDCFRQSDHPEVPLCGDHLLEAGLTWLRDNLDIVREVVEATPVPVLMSRELRTAGQRAAERPPPEQGEAVVYYIRMRGTDRVKIGTTTSLPQRMVALRADGEDLMATEPGGYDVEWRRHHQFADERYGRREEFALSERLLEHIASLQ